MACESEEEVESVGHNRLWSLKEVHSSLNSLAPHRVVASYHLPRDRAQRHSPSTSTKGSDDNLWCEIDYGSLIS